MRRALVVAATLAVPALAAAQSIAVGAIQFTDGTNDLVHGRFISFTECSDASAQVNLAWNTQLNTGATFPTGAKYTVYASNKQTTDTNCLKTDVDASGIKAGAVGTTITGQPQQVPPQPFSTAQFVAVAGYTCTTTADTPIYVCVQLYQSDGVTAVGLAKGTLTLSTSKPGSPTDVRAVPADDGALDISWTPPGGSPTAFDYVVKVIGTVAPDTTTHTRSDITATSVIVSGLQNDELYNIQVFARTEAGNLSDNPGTTTATPRQVLNYWDLYHDTYGGREQGGCSTGAAGPIALLAVAALVAALRRRS